VADIREARGPNVIQRENAQNRFVVSINPTSSDLSGLAGQLREAVAGAVGVPEGYLISYEGEFREREQASYRIALFSAVVFTLIATLLFAYFRSFIFTLQVICDVPLALIGGLALTYHELNNISIATLVGFIAVAGVAARNSVMLLSHYLHVLRHEDRPFSRAAIEQATLERLVPVLMTALATGIALVPLVLASGEPGKEILHPVAVVIVGGLATATLLGLGVTPAVFHAFGRKAAAKAIAAGAPASL
jgi:Cu/Ag efflux pump CusA